MPGTPQSLMNYLRVLSGALRDDPRTDDELLARFAATNDETSFQVLVYRHRMLVWRICQRILGNTQESEDAFQATFLALTRKARRLTIANLAGWLHRVARQIALNARAAVRRRQKLESRLQTEVQSEVNDLEQDEQHAVIDEELAGLPEKLRIPLILHYLEEKTQVEIARILGCTQSAVQKRLKRAEAALQKRVVQRGLAPGIGLAAALLSDKGGISAAPAGLIANTAQAAVTFRTGTLTGAAAEAAEKLLRSLSWTGTMWKGGWLVLACVGALGTGGAGYVAWKMYGDGSDKAVPAVPDTHKTVAPKAVVKPRDPRIDCYGDPLPDGALARIGTVRFRPLRDDAFSSGVAFLPDGKTLVSSNEGFLYFWEWSTGKELRRSKEKFCGTEIAVSPDGKVLATNGEYWDLTADPPRQLERAMLPAPCLKRRDGCYSVAFSPDGRTVAWADRHCRGLSIIYLVDASTGKVKKTLEDKLRPNDKTGGWRLAFSPDNKTLAAGGSLGKTILWDVATGTKLLQIAGNGDWIAFLAFLPDGRTLVESKLKAEGETGSNGPMRMGFFDAATGVEKPSAKTPRAPNRFCGKDQLGGMCLSQDGKLLALNQGNAISVWDMETDREVGPAGGLHSVVNRLEFSSDSKKLITTIMPSSHWGLQQFWDANTGRLEAERIPAALVPFLPGSPDRLPGRVPSSDSRQQAVVTLASAKGCPHALSPDGRWLAVTSSPAYGAVHLWEVASVMENGNKFEMPGGVIWNLAWSPDGRLLAGGDEKGTVWLWDVAAGQEVRRFTGHQALVAALAFSPDGLRLASGSWDTTALIWDLHCLPLPEVREKDLPAAETLWATLGGRNPATARRSIHLLTQMPDAALSLLRERLRPAPVSDLKRVTTLLTQLDDDNFQVRKQAEEQLEKMGEEIEPALQTALAKKLSPEVRQRIDNVLYKLLGPRVGPKSLNLVQLQAWRGVEVLERIGTPAARQVLEELSRLPAGLVQAEEAKAALQRLTKPTPALMP